MWFGVFCLIFRKKFLWSQRNIRAKKSQMYFMSRTSAFLLLLFIFVSFDGWNLSKNCLECVLHTKNPWRRIEKAKYDCFPFFAKPTNKWFMNFFRIERNRKNIELGRNKWICAIFFFFARPLSITTAQTATGAYLFVPSNI